MSLVRPFTEHSLTWPEIRQPRSVGEHSSEGQEWKDEVGRTWLGDQELLLQRPWIIHFRAMSVSRIRAIADIISLIINNPH